MIDNPQNQATTINKEIIFSYNSLLSKYLQSKKYTRTQLSEIAETIKSTAQYILYIDKQTNSNIIFEYMESFKNSNILKTLYDYFYKENEDIPLIILQEFFFVFTNIKNNDILNYIYTKKFISKENDGQNNIIDSMILYETKKEEFLSFQVNLMKSLTLKLNKDSLKYFYDFEINNFPILSKALFLYNHPDEMIRGSVKNIILNITKIEDENLRTFLVQFPIVLYYPDLIFSLKITIQNLSSNFQDLDQICSERSIKKNIFNFIQDKNDELIDMILYISDLLSINIKEINFIITNCLLKEIILPLLKIIISNKKEMISIIDCFYVLALFIYYIKDNFITNFISEMLFSEKIPDKLLEIILNNHFYIVDNNFIYYLRILITNNKEADINDESWQKISKNLQKVIGMDIATGYIDQSNILNTILNINKNYTKNKIFDKIKEFFSSNDDCFILILNVLIFAQIQNYKKNKNSNKISKFFDVNSEVDENIFGILINKILNYKNFRQCTNEIILNNISEIIKITPNNLIKSKNAFNYVKLINTALKSGIKFIDDLLRKYPNLQISFYSCLSKAYQEIINESLDEKIKKLIISYHILIPLIYLNEEVPENFKQIKENSNNFLINLLEQILILIETKSNITKNKLYKFTLLNKNAEKNFEKNQIINVTDMGDEYAFCVLLDKNYIKCVIIIIDDMFYLGEILSGNFKDLSKIKIIKKIELKYLNVIISMENPDLLLEISNINNDKENFIINCFDLENTKKMHKYLIDMKNNFYYLEISLFESFCDYINKVLSE